MTDQRDPGDECDRCHDQLTLPVAAPAKVCRWCNASVPIRCEFDRLGRYAYDRPRFRPRGCIAIPNPSTAEIPF